MDTTYLVGSVLCSIGITLIVNVMARLARRRPTRPPATRPANSYESRAQFMARLIEQEKAPDPADWWRRGEEPKEWGS